MKNEEAIKIEKEIENSGALQIHNRISYLVDVFQIYERNFIELRKLLIAFNTPETILPVWDVDKRDELNLLIVELIRLLHNYLASINTLVDHTRILIKNNYQKTDLQKEYQNKIDDSFASDPLACFIKNLRNFILHLNLPATFSKIEMHLDPITKNQITSSKVFIKKKSLLYWSGWSTPAKEYLKNSSDEIDLLLVINLHYDKTIDFNKWLLQKLKTIHSSELIWLQEKSKQLKNFWDEINST